MAINCSAIVFQETLKEKDGQTTYWALLLTPLCSTEPPLAVTIAGG